MSDSKSNKIILSPEDMPRQWYNIQPDLPSPIPPPLDGETGKPPVPEKLFRLFATDLVKQELNTQDSYIDIPDEIVEAYQTILNRPSHLVRAKRLEKALGTPAEIYYKNEGYNPAGSHKPNTAIAQAYYATKDNLVGLATETGAGQWGSALSLACNYFDLKCMVFMVRVSYDQKPYRRILMESYNAKVAPSPSDITNTGKAVLKDRPDYHGSLGLAISEAVEYAVSNEGYKYSLGSVLSHVLMHQTIIGLEAKKQFESVDKYPDYVVGCFGGGSNFAGFSYPFIRDKIKKTHDPEVIAVEAASIPKNTSGEYKYDYGDEAGIVFKAKMYTLGHTFAPPPIHAGGLRYHGGAPSYGVLQNQGIIKPKAYHQTEVFEAGLLFARTEGLIPAPETNHAIKEVVELAKECKKTGEKKIIAFNFSGHGFFDLLGYDQYLNGKMVDY